MKTTAYIGKNILLTKMYILYKCIKCILFKNNKSAFVNVYCLKIIINQHFTEKKNVFKLFYEPRWSMRCIQLSYRE